MASASTRRRAAITGFGAITSVGETAGSTWNAILEGRSGCGPITRFPADGFPVRIAAEVPRGWWGEVKHASLAYTFAEKAVAEALATAGLPTDGGLGPETAIVVGIGGDDSGDDMPLDVLDTLGRLAPESPYAELGRRVHDRVDLLRDRLNLEGIASALALRFGAEGPASCVATACASGAHAVALAADLLAEGAARRAIAVGTDAMVNRVNLSNFCALGVLSRRNAHPTSACRPFDSRRQGFVISEGAGTVVLELAAPDGAWRVPPRGFLVGHGVSADAYSITDKESDGTGVFNAIAQAIEQGGVDPQRIAYVNAHGTGTLQNDMGEIAALRRALGARLKDVPISSIKGQIGHTIAAAGAIEAIVTLMAVDSGRAPGTSTLEVVQPEFADLRIPGPGVVPVERGVGLSISAGFGGVNVCLLVEGRAS